MMAHAYPGLGVHGAVKVELAGGKGASLDAGAVQQWAQQQQLAQLQQVMSSAVAALIPLTSSLLLTRTSVHFVSQHTHLHQHHTSQQLWGLSQQPAVPLGPPPDRAGSKGKRKGKKTHFCAVCSKVFTRPSDVIRHMRTHTGEKPFSCDDCGSRFSDQVSRADAHTYVSPCGATRSHSDTCMHALRRHASRHTHARTCSRTCAHTGQPDQAQVLAHAGKELGTSRARIHRRSRAHTHALIHVLALTHSHSRIHIYSKHLHIKTCTDARAHTYTLIHTASHGLARTDSHSIKITFTRTHSYSPTLTHTQSHSITPTHTHFTLTPLTPLSLHSHAYKSTHSRSSASTATRDSCGLALCCRICVCTARRPSSRSRITSRAPFPRRTWCPASATPSPPAPAAKSRNPALGL